MSIVSTGLNLADKGINVFKKSVLCTKPHNIANINFNNLKYIQNTGEDVFELKNTATKINLQLKNIYNIDSKISNPEISKRVLETVKDYCTVNKNNNLLSGAIIKQEFLKNANKPCKIAWNHKTKNFSITFNENFDWKNSKQISQKLYDDCVIPVNHPNFYIYKNFANFLNFKHNPYAYKYNNDKDFINKSELKVLRVSKDNNINSFNANYLAAKMLEKNYPKELKTIFEAYGGNTNIKFPKPTPNKILQGSIHHFINQKDAINYLSKIYGIDANFINTEQANLFAGAVDDLSKAIGSNEYFKGLKVAVNGDVFDDLITKMAARSNSFTEEMTIFINPAYNWGNAKN